MEFDEPFPSQSLADHAPAHANARHEYRSTQPVMMSSSPGRDQEDHFQFQSPVTPPSSPPLSPSTRLFRATTASDPFSAAAKADVGQHPQFGKQYPHAKHPGRLRGKRSLPASPGSPAPTVGAAAGAASSSQGQSSRAPWPVNHNRALAGRSRVAAQADASESSGAEGSTEIRRDRVLHSFFELSDDAPTSDDHLEAAPWEHSGSDADNTTGHASIGLGLGASFKEQGSPTSARRFYSRGMPSSSATPSHRSSSFSRTSSVSDPFGALGSAGSLLHAHDHRPTLPSPRQPASQRRRLTGTSPKKPITSTPNRGTWSDSDDDDQGAGAALFAPPLGSQGSPSRPTPSQLWHQVVDTVFDSGETSIDLSDRRMTSIHPIVADLAKFVAIDPPRAFDKPAPPPPSSVRGTPSSVRSFGRTSTNGFGSPMQSGSGEAQTVRGAGRGRLQLYVANNCLTKLPSALFEVGNLRVLSLRKNNLTVLPPAIGELQNLRELNVAGNQLRYLPAEIQKLTLDQFFYFPNPFMEPPQGSKLEVRSIYSITGGILGGEAEERLQHQQQNQQGPLESMEAEEDAEEAEMEEAFLASAPEHASGSSQTQPAAVPLATPQGPPEPSGMMGPPALPARLLRVLGHTPQRLRDNNGAADGTVVARPRTFDRTMSDAQVDDLLARGGGPMLSRPPASSGLASAMGLPPPAADTSTDPDDSMDSLMNGSGPRPPLPVPARIPGPMQLMRVLGPLEVTQPRLASLRELCIRRLLSPVEVEATSRPATPEAAGAAASNATQVQVGAGRSVAWSRVPSSSSAFQFQYHGGKRPTTLLENYENGALREIESKAQMEASTIAVLEAARRSIEGRWGSGSGHMGLTSRTASSASRASSSRAGGGARSASAAANDSWCKGVAGVAGKAAMGVAIGGGRSDDEMDADADDSSPEPTDGFDETVVSLSPSCASRRSHTHTHAHIPAPSPVVDVSTLLDTEGDDSSANPHFNRCPNPCHAETHQLARAAGVRLGGAGGGGASTANVPIASTPVTPRSLSMSAGAGGMRQHTGVTPTPSPVRPGQPTTTTAGSGSGSGSPALSTSSALSCDYPLSPRECPYAPLFERAMCTRMEWVSHIGGFKVLSAANVPEGREARGSGVLPVLWRGCGRACLDFLER